MRIYGPRSGGCEQRPQSHRDAAYFLYELALSQPRHAVHLSSCYPYMRVGASL